MNKAELIELLEPYEDDTEVRLMSQAHYPFEYSLENNVFDVSPAPDACGDCGLTQNAHADDAHPLTDHPFEPYETFEPADPHAETVVYLLEGTQLGYGTRSAWGS